MSRSPARHRVSNDMDEVNEADLIASAPVINTTADTAAKLASNPNFKPDYIIELPEPQAKPRA
jgi:hypothetical protein